jgi:hypothetical protein
MCLFGRWQLWAELSRQNHDAHSCDHSSVPWMIRGRGEGAQMCRIMSAHLDGRLAYLKTELKIADFVGDRWMKGLEWVKGQASSGFRRKAPTILSWR